MFRNYSNIEALYESKKEEIKKAASYGGRAFDLEAFNADVEKRIKKAFLSGYFEAQSELRELFGKLVLDETPNKTDWGL